MIVSVLFLLVPDFLAKFYLFKFMESYSNIAHYFASIFTIIGLFLIIYKSSRSIIGLSIKKFNINSAEIEIDEGISKSILNNHLDEIIYFFEATKYNVVIIEDLDRFEQTEVFTKLREINLLINGSNKIKRPVVFLYAIKDDMFLDKDRAKFFDFMIPIIPVINFSNSGDKLRKIVQQNNYNISDDLLDDLSMFIDDMRLLYNIMNEYHIYTNRINSELDQDKLLSMIVYKNIFPNDFTLLGQNEGDLYKTLSNKSEYIMREISKLDEQIDDIKRKIQNANETQISNLKELRIIYLSKIVEKINNSQSNYPFYQFVNDNSKFSISAYATGDIFNFYEGNILYVNNNNPNHDRSFQYKAIDLEKEINPNLTYSMRIDAVQDKSRINSLKKEIEKINLQKSQVQKSKIRDLLLTKQILIENDSNKKSDLIQVLLRNGYIDEDYLDYISIFHEGALTKFDYQFLINIKTEKNSEFNYKLFKADELIKKINEFAFEKEFVLNFDLVDAILKVQNQKAKKQRLFQQLSNEKEITLLFIDKFIDSTANIDLFISELCKYWTNIWNYIYGKSIFSDERIEKYFRLIIQYAEIKSISEIFKDSDEYINNYSEFLNIPANSKTLEQVIEYLDIKFNLIEIDSPSNLLNYLFENNHYAINEENIKTLLSVKGVTNWESFNKMNYYFLTSREYPYLEAYIEENIEEYVESIFLKLETNTEEKIDSYIKLLNNELLNSDLKEKIIIKTMTIIEEYDSINDNNVCNLLFKHSKIRPTWDNILLSFEKEENKLNQNVIDYLNSQSNAECLSEIRMTTDKIDDNYKFRKLCDEIIIEAKISLESYKLLIKSIPWCYEFFDTAKLSRNRIIVLIENNKVNPTIKGYEFLKENFNGLNILLLEKYLDKFKDSVDQLSIDSEDLKQILKSVKIDYIEKFAIINSCEDAIILDNPESSRIVSQLLVESNKYEVNDSLKLSLMKNADISVTDRIQLFNKFISLVNIRTINDFLVSLGGAYKEITNKGKKATIEENSLNHELMKNLIVSGYIKSKSITKKGLRVNHKRKK